MNSTLKFVFVLNKKFSQVDFEIKKILNDSYDRAKNILKVHAKEHKALAEALLKYETLDAEDIKAILAGDKIAAEASR